MDTKIMNATLKVIGILATLSVIAFPVSAGAVPMGFTNGTCGYSPNSRGCSAYGGYASADLGSLTATAQISGDASHAGGVSESLTYYFQLMSSSGYDYSQVPLLVTSNLVTTMGGGGSFNNGFAEAGYSVAGGGSTACSGYGCGGLPTSYAGTETIWLSLSDYVYTVYVSAIAVVNSDGPTSMYASADPFIEIDPTYLLNHQGLSLSFSSNITNTPPNPGSNPVPAPPTAWLLAAGLLGLIGTSRRTIRA